jgi:hypothetical protein
VKEINAVQDDCHSLRAAANALPPSRCAPPPRFTLPPAVQDERHSLHAAANALLPSRCAPPPPPPCRRQANDNVARLGLRKSPPELNATPVITKSPTNYVAAAASTLIYQKNYGDSNSGTSGVIEEMETHRMCDI